MSFTTVEGQDRGDVKLFTLSTCPWCKKTKEFLEKLGVRFAYCDMDTLEDQEQDRLVSRLDSIDEKWGFPTVLIRDNIMISGHKTDRIKQALGLD